MSRRNLLLCIGGGVVLLLGASAALILPRPSKSPPQQPLLRISTGTFAEGSVAHVFGKNGLSEADAAGVAHSLKGILDPRRLHDQDRYSLAVSTCGIFQHLLIVRKLKEYSVHRDEHTRSFSAAVADAAKTSVRKSANGKIRHFLWESFLDAGLSPALVVAFADIFAWKIDFLTECHEGDRYALVWEENRTGDGQVVGRKILAAAYDGQVAERRLAIRFEDGYYDEKGESLASTFLRAPLQYHRISSFFTKKRFHPILRIFRPHNGIDFAAPVGTPVSCVADRLVLFSGWKGGYGKYVEVRHKNDYVTGYGHLSRIAKGVKPGARVEQGQIIGHVGKTGLATGPHLDFSIRESGEYVNYLKLKFQTSGSIGRKQRHEFFRMADGLVRELKSLLR